MAEYGTGISNSPDVEKTTRSGSTATATIEAP